MRLKTNKKITPVIVSTNNDKWKIESAGVDSGLKILGLLEEATDPPKHNRAASRNPVSKTRRPVALLTRIRVCSLHFICHTCHENSRRTSLDELRSIAIDIRGTAGWSGEGHWQLTATQFGLRVCVQTLIGICRAKTLNIEIMRFTTFSLTRIVRDGDRILAAAQILTPGFSGGI